MEDCSPLLVAVGAVMEASVYREKGCKNVCKNLGVYKIIIVKTSDGGIWNNLPLYSELKGCPQLHVHTYIKKGECPRGSDI